MKNAVTKILKPYFKRGSDYDRQEFADYVGISTRTLVNILSGNTSLTMDQMVKASDFLKVDLFKLFLKEVGRPETIVEEPTNEYRKIEPLDVATIQITLRAQTRNFTKFPELLKTIKEKGATLGFEIT